MWTSQVAQTVNKQRPCLVIQNFRKQVFFAGGRRWGSDDDIGWQASGLKPQDAVPGDTHSTPHWH